MLAPIPSVGTLGESSAYEPSDASGFLSRDSSSGSRGLARQPSVQKITFAPLARPEKPKIATVQERSESRRDDSDGEEFYEGVPMMSTPPTRLGRLGASVSASGAVQSAGGQSLTRLASNDSLLSSLGTPMRSPLAADRRSASSNASNSPGGGRSQQTSVQGSPLIRGTAGDVHFEEAKSPALSAEPGSPGVSGDVSSPGQSSTGSFEDGTGRLGSSGFSRPGSGAARRKKAGLGINTGVDGGNFSPRQPSALAKPASEASLLPMKSPPTVVGSYEAGVSSPSNAAAVSRRPVPTPGSTGNRSAGSGIAKAPSSRNSGLTSVAGGAGRSTPTSERSDAASKCIRLVA